MRGLNSTRLKGYATLFKPDPRQQGRQRFDRKDAERVEKAVRRAKITGDWTRAWAVIRECAVRAGGSE